LFSYFIEAEYELPVTNLTYPSRLNRYSTDAPPGGTQESELP
jgi:hypothetical protein